MIAARMLWTGMALGSLIPLGCSPVHYGPAKVIELKQRAVQCLKLGIRYEPLATVRVQAIEVLQEVGGRETLPWIRHTLHDEVPAVRFAALLALGMHRDRIAEPAIRKLLDSNVASDRIAAIFALHCLGETRHTGELATYLLEDHDTATRCHAALVLGRIGEKGALDLLTRTMLDASPSLRANVLESMALLGSEQARTILHENAYGGIGGEETFAITVLGQLRDPKYRTLFLQRLETTLHIEAKLAAVRALGMLGDDAGFKIAHRALSYRTRKNRPNDPAANQTFRVRQMAALALGAIGDRLALGDLEKMMNKAKDPRLQIAAAKAVLDILDTDIAPSMRGR